MNDDYSDLYGQPVEALGSGGYCDLAAEVLREFHPDAKIYRITDDDGDRFAHVFLRVGDRAMDITGVCSPEDMLQRHNDVDGARLEQTTPEAVANSFLGHSRTADERQIVMERFREHINAKPGNFLLNVQ